MQTRANQSALTVGQCAAFACFLEATAPKPGNVHRGADFEDLTFPDLIASAIAIASVMDQAASEPLGQTIYRAVQATGRVVSSNSNLGMVLLLAPLAAATQYDDLQPGVRRVLDGLTPGDARLAYEAIRLARPGGMGNVEQSDIRGEPPPSLIDAMRLAAERDMVARQYANGFADLFEAVIPALSDALKRFRLSDAIVYAYLSNLAQFPDSLIGRKCGLDTAQRASDHAAQVLRSGSPGDEAYHEALADLDFWLRSDGHRRNPGTTADLVTAALFVTLWEGDLRPPFDWRVH